MYDISESQEALLVERSTKPTFLVEVLFDVQEYLSTNGDILVDSNLFKGSDIGIRSASDWSSASLKFNPTTSRLATIISGGWQGNPCRIYLLPRVNYLGLYEDDYVEEEYGVNGEDISDKILLIDGVITSATAGDTQISVEVTHKSFVGKWTPRLRITSQIANHLPQDGTVVVWEGDNYVLESR